MNELELTAERIRFALPVLFARDPYHEYPNPKLGCWNLSDDVMVIVGYDYPANAVTYKAKRLQNDYGVNLAGMTPLGRENLIKRAVAECVTELRNDRKEIEIAPVGAD